MIWEIPVNNLLIRRRKIKSTFLHGYVIAITGLILCVQVQAYRIAEIPPPIPTEDSDYGWASATDGQTLVVGAYGENKIYIYERNGLDWQYVTSHSNTAGKFGYSVDVDGDTIVVGAYGYNSNQGAIYVFEKDSTNGWDVDPIQFVVSGGQAGDLFGHSVAIDGDTIVAGAYSADDDKGAAYVYEYSSGNWGFKQKLEDPDGKPAGEHVSGSQFGFSVGVDGDIIIVGAVYDYDDYSTTWRRGSACVFRRVGGLWDQSGMVKLIPSQWQRLGCFGQTVAISEGLIAVGSPNTYKSGLGYGSVYVFRWSGSAWIEEEILYSPEPDDSYYFGDSLSLDGERLVIGDYLSGTSYSGSAYLFEWDGEVWSDGTELIAGGSGDRLGKSVAICGDVVVVGAYRVDDGQVLDVGMVYALTICNYDLAGDLNDDCRVDFHDFALMAENWLIDCDTNPSDPACVPK